jgi:antitoxin component YwqK of YwqJK toxin-antitoxin module
MNSKNNLIIGIFIILISSCVTQKKYLPIKDAVYLDKYQAEITDPRKASSYRIITRDSVDKNIALARTYFMTGKLKSEIALANEATLEDREWKMNNLRNMLMDTDNKTLWTLNGKYKEWYESGKLKKIIDYKNGYLVNRLTTFWENYKIKRNEKYDENSNFMYGECYDKRGKVIKYSDYSTYPFLYNSTYTSTNEYIKLNTQYPKAALQYKEAGIVLIYNYLDGRGKNFKNIIRYALNPVLNQEALRLIKSIPGYYTSATVDGEPCAFVNTISVRFNLPIFTIDLLRNSKPTDSVYYDRNGFVKKNKSQAITIEQYIPTKNDSNLISRITYNKSGVKLSEVTIDKTKTINNIESVYDDLYSNTAVSTQSEINKNQVLEGPSLSWYENGNLKKKLNYISGEFDGH